MSRFTYLIGGKAGEGVKTAGSAASALSSEMGLSVFQMDDYPSLIRGGHNFSVVTTDAEMVWSHREKADLVVNLDARSYHMHKEHVKTDGLLVFNSDKVEDGEGIGIPMTEIAKEGYTRPKLILGVAGIGVLAAALGMRREKVEDFVGRRYSKGKEENVSYALEIYGHVVDELGGRFKLKKGDIKGSLLTGNQAIALGGASAGLDMYISYPMTPASSILHFLASKGKKLGVTVVHPENEIAVANMAIGATVTGSRVMVGTSDGGFALMEEAYSLAGMSESPVLFILSSRPGPSTGVPTYTEQGDLQFALNQGHGDFSRIVASPGSVGQAFRLAGEMLSLVWKYQTPGILLTEKHLSESTMLVELVPEDVKVAKADMYEGDEGYKRYEDTENGVSPLKFPPHHESIKWNSYEHDEKGITTEEANTVVSMHEKRYRKEHTLIEDLKQRSTVNVYGDGDNVIFAYGSTTLALREVVKDLQNVVVVQPVYLRPLPVWELEQYEKKRSVVVEQSVSGQFATLLKEKVGIRPVKVIKRYDGRPFEPDGLTAELEEVFKDG